MELELGLKFTRISDEFTSDFQIAKDRAGTLFLSRETDTMFVLTAHLKGYKRGNIKIDINEDGSLIGISGERQIKETVMVGWKVYKKDAEIRGFKKVFRIPDGVILDKIKAVFNEDESTLTITMPKKVKGIRGFEIEEVKEEHDHVKEGSGSLHIADEQSLEKGEKVKEKIEDRVDDSKDGQETRKEDEENRRKVEERIENQEGDKETDVVENEERLDEEKEGAYIVGTGVKHRGEDERGEGTYVVGTGVECRGEDEGGEGEGEGTYVVGTGVERRGEDERGEGEGAYVVGTGVEHRGEDERGEGEGEGAYVVGTGVEHRGEDERGEGEEGGEKRCKMCLPIVVGSTLLLSFVVFVIQIIRSKNRSSTRRD